MQVNVPCFHRATSIELQGLDLAFAESSPKCFPSLKRLVLSGCRATISNWVRRSPRLLVLRVSTVTNDGLKIIIVRSKSLQELSVETKIPFLGNKPPLLDNVNIEAPLLKQLTISFAAGGYYNNLLVSVSAPLLEKVSWKCAYFTAAAGLGRWGLLHVGLKPVETNNGQGHLPHIHVLSLSAETHSSYMFSGAAQELRFKAEIKKHMLIGFSMLELRIMTSDHVYGAFALRILGLDGIFALIKALKIVLVASEGKEACPENCRCEEPKDWRTQSIYLPNLEEVEIRGEDHEFDFWKLVISGAPNLKRVVMDKPSNEVKMDSWRMKIITILGPGIAIAGGCDGA
ncbi:uncharacterized protein LOC124672141 [Lolium rigidum]|uniref:uncharacterized protein LOC124672141 n=1 Tax=Lolium rigidum TaxID=89674 RepID=UPI001F5C39ED|nr:uncharacterized protein LOC124672141 [Lolium rigidum]